MGEFELALITYVFSAQCLVSKVKGERLVKGETTHTDIYDQMFLKMYLVDNILNNINKNEYVHVKAEDFKTFDKL